MFDHVKFGVSDYAASKAFFLKALEPLGIAVVSEGPPTYGVELSPKGKASLCLYQTDEKPAHLHLAFTAEDRQQVERSIARLWRRVAKTMVRRPAPALPRELLCSFRHWSGRAQHRNGLPRTQGLTFPIEGTSTQTGFARLRSPLMSNVRRQRRVPRMSPYTSCLLQLRSAHGPGRRRACTHLHLPLLGMPTPNWQRFWRASQVSSRGCIDLGHLN